jgi:hypothetical protein
MRHAILRNAVTAGIGIAIIGAVVASGCHAAGDGAALHAFAAGYSHGLGLAATLAVAAAIVAALTLDGRAEVRPPASPAVIAEPA